LLLEAKGVDLDKADAFGQCALLHASAFGHFEVAVALLKAGASAPVPPAWMFPGAMTNEALDDDDYEEVVEEEEEEEEEGEGDDRP